MSSIPVAVLCMVKNEADTIAASIDSTKDYIDHIIIYDTGSTDNTIDIIKQTCNKNGQTLHLKTTNVFKDFAQSRNESLEFAHTIPAQYLIMMDAGDELKIGSLQNPAAYPKQSKSQFHRSFQYIPPAATHGSVILQWLEEGTTTEHYDIRFIKNHCGAKYDTEFPVHESFKDITSLSCFQVQHFYLYQDRYKYGAATQYRFQRDIELLSRAKPSKRNLYYLAQSYMASGDLTNGFKYNIKASQEPGDFDDKTLYARIAYCALCLNMDHSISLKYLKLALPSLEAYVNLLRFCIQNKMPNEVSPYFEKIAELQKVPGNAINHDQYDYLRWHLILRVCILYIECPDSNKTPGELRKIMEMGKRAGGIAIRARNMFEDRSMMRIIDNFMMKGLN